MPAVKTLLIEGINQVDSTTWKNFINRVKKEEEKFWESDFIVDDLLTAEQTPVEMTIGNRSDSSSSEDF